MIRHFTTRASPEAVERHGLRQVDTTTRTTNHATECLGQPASVPGDIGPMPMALVKVPVDPVKCRTRLGRLLAGAVDRAQGPITVTCTSKKRTDIMLNGHRPGSKKHKELCALWGIDDGPLAHVWDGWTNICRQKFETGEQYFDRMARLIAGDLVDETFQIVVGVSKGGKE